MRMRFAGLVGAVASMGLIALDARAEEEKVALNKLPAAVTKAVRAKFPNAKAKEASKEVEKGKTIYEVELEADGRDVSVSLKPDGTILEVEKEIEISALPKPVAEALKSKYPKATIKTAETLEETGEELVYEIELEEAGKKPFEVTVDAKGKIEVDDEDEKD